MELRRGKFEQSLIWIGFLGTGKGVLEFIFVLVLNAGTFNTSVVQAWKSSCE